MYSDTANYSPFFILQYHSMRSPDLRSACVPCLRQGCPPVARQCTARQSRLMSVTCPWILSITSQRDPTYITIERAPVASGAIEGRLRRHAALHRTHLARCAKMQIGDSVAWTVVVWTQLSACEPQACGNDLRIISPSSIHKLQLVHLCVFK